MAQTWQLQEAKNRFSQVVQEAILHGPQKITRHGRAAVVIVSIQDYKKLSRSTVSLAEFFQRSPLKGMRLDLGRNKMRGRKISL